MVINIHLYLYPLVSCDQKTKIVYSICSYLYKNTAQNDTSDSLLLDVYTGLNKRQYIYYVPIMVCQNEENKFVIASTDFPSNVSSTYEMK